MSLPVVSEETIEVVQAQFDREGNSLDYVSGISAEMDESQPHLKEGIVDSVKCIMNDLEVAGLDGETNAQVGAAIISLCFMVVRSIEAQVETKELEELFG